MRHRYSGLVPPFIFLLYVEMTNSNANRPVVKVVEFYRTIAVVHFICGYWTEKTTAFKYDRQWTTHIEWAKKWIKKFWVKDFLKAQSRLIQAWLVHKIENKWTFGWWMDRWMLVYSEWTTPAKRDAIFVAPQGLFA